MTCTEMSGNGVRIDMVLTLRVKPLTPEDQIQEVTGYAGGGVGLSTDIIAEAPIEILASPRADIRPRVLGL